MKTDKRAKVAEWLEKMAEEFDLLEHSDYQICSEDSKMLREAAKFIRDDLMR